MLTWLDSSLWVWKKDLPEENEERVEEGAEIIASMDNTVLSGILTRLCETNFSKQLHSDDGKDEEEHCY